MIRVLQVLGSVGLGGAESRIMDLYRHMDREKIQFDFLISRQRWHFFCGEFLPASFERMECCVLCQNKGTSYRKIPHEALLVPKWHHGE